MYVCVCVCFIFSVFIIVKITISFLYIPSAKERICVTGPIQSPCPETTQHSGTVCSHFLLLFEGEHSLYSSNVVKCKMKILRAGLQLFASSQVFVS